ncbi:MAG: Stp1/IreP family PP2C-type Ser/Thr phosphatase [Bdellovibrionales bacterium]|nr:Stp1/IreP family PP2C-type Ser/Thr phosphatase [Bdellovibrionales bacterium]
MASKEFSIRVAGKSDIGRKRSNNQDSFIVNEAWRLFSVADGMGGHSGGEVASAMAVRTLDRIFQDLRETSVPQRLVEAFRLSNKVIFDQSMANPRLHGMGTTMTAAAVDGHYVHIAQVGDSRCYLYREGVLYQLTEDHSQVYELLKAGLITEDNMGSVQKNVITRSVGYEEHVNVDIFSRKAQVDDRYVICSDGLSGMVSNEQIARILQNFDVEDAVQKLVDLANIQGGEDNISVIVFELGKSA